MSVNVSHSRRHRAGPSEPFSLAVVTPSDWGVERSLLPALNQGTLISRDFTVVHCYMLADVPNFREPQDVATSKITYRYIYLRKCHYFPFLLVSSFLRLTDTPVLFSASIQTVDFFSQLVLLSINCHLFISS